MNGFSAIIFDEQLQADSTGSVTTTTSLTHLEPLTRADQIVIHAIATAVTGAVGSLTVAIQTSPDGRTWVQKNAAGEINLGTRLGVSSELSGWAGEATLSNPSMGFVQLGITVTASAGNVARVRIGVAARSKTKRIRRVAATPKPEQRRRIVSEETMQEIYGHLMSSSHLHGQGRVEHVLQHLSGPARTEVEAYTSKFMNMSPLVKHAIGGVAEAIAHLTKMPAPEGRDASELLPAAFAKDSSGEDVGG